MNSWKILILLDPYNLPVCQNLPFLDLPKMAIGSDNDNYTKCLGQDMLYKEYWSNLM